MSGRRCAPSSTATPQPQPVASRPTVTPKAGPSRSPTPTARRACCSSPRGRAPPPVVIDQMLVPPESYGVRCISMGFFAEEDQPVIWRGPMLHKALEQFLTDVFWDEPDFLVVDLPPGTGDISISLAQFLPRAEVYVVTTPQPAAQRVAQRAAFMAQKVNLEVRGVIENMSWFTGDDGKRYELFGAGGGDELAT